MRVHRGRGAGDLRGDAAARPYPAARPVGKVPQAAPVAARARARRRGGGVHPARPHRRPAGRSRASRGARRPRGRHQADHLHAAGLGEVADRVRGVPAVAAAQPPRLGDRPGLSRGIPGHEVLQRREAALRRAGQPAWYRRRHRLEGRQHRARRHHRPRDQGIHVGPTPARRDHRRPDQAHGGRLQQEDPRHRMDGLAVRDQAPHAPRLDHPVHRDQVARRRPERPPAQATRVGNARHPGARGGERRARPRRRGTAAVGAAGGGRRGRPGALGAHQDRGRQRDLQCAVPAAPGRAERHGVQARMVAVLHGRRASAGRPGDHRVGPEFRHRWRDVR